jgi:hypothetical protein
MVRNDVHEGLIGLPDENEDVSRDRAVNLRRRRVP